MMYLLIVIRGLICNYVRGIGLFPITGYCSNTTSCTKNHCELKSNNVWHCYRGKRFFFFFFFQVRILTFPGMLPMWIKCTVMYLSLPGSIWKILSDKCVWNSRLTVVLFLICITFMEHDGLVREQSSFLSSEMHKEWNQRRLHKVIN